MLIALRWKAIWQRLRDGFDGFAKLSYSQEGEDRVLARVFEGRGAGFYVDVGAHHPRRYSNTFTFYQRGWSGINIDATPGSMTAFQKQRPRDTNLELAILNDRRRLRYFQFNEPALNTFSEELCARNSQLAGYHLVSTVELRGVPLCEVLSQYLPQDVQHIDFLSVDAEGFDLEVLQSNNWSEFRPRLILVEMLNNLIDSAATDPVCQFLRSHNYHLFAKTVQTVFFISDEYRMERGLVAVHEELAGVIGR